VYEPWLVDHSVVNELARRHGLDQDIGDVGQGLAVETVRRGGEHEHVHDAVALAELGK
jgi:hypothetical protein